MDPIYAEVSEDGFLKGFSSTKPTKTFVIKVLEVLKVTVIVVSIAASIILSAALITEAAILFILSGVTAEFSLAVGAVGAGAVAAINSLYE